MTRTIRLTVSATLAAALLAAGPAAVAARSASPSQGAALIQKVKIVEFQFKPGKVAISVGSTVKWINKGQLTHTTTSDTGLWSKTLKPGASFKRAFNKAGTFKYHCMIHPSMTGTVVVNG